ncbi:response regulator receiver domain-containing protein [Flavobacterium sp. 270]|uniref:response regulator n=1 Tax=Flavobacterium sp. 270 TaxID=2512114 RepID=UPI001066EB82|nr:response regulator [Flavobacterium sp. 270]TDW46679.1 response regulator receiver domain-containing protein [Flavobacterium sp. 270]
MAFEKHNSRKFIYLADDDSDDRDFFADALLETDPAVVLKQFQDGMYLMDDLLAIDPAELPEFIFLDINMPRKTGLECLEEISSHENLKDLTVIMLSTSNDPDNISTARELGAAFYAVKPSSFEKLKSLLEDVLRINLMGSIEEKRKFLLQ